VCALNSRLPKYRKKLLVAMDFHFAWGQGRQRSGSVPDTSSFPCRREDCCANQDEAGFPDDPCADGQRGGGSLFAYRMTALRQSMKCFSIFSRPVLCCIRFVPPSGDRPMGRGLHISPRKTTITGAYFQRIKHNVLGCQSVAWMLW